ncbi:MAG: hypothetical protein ACYSWO_08220 [Planctomycetota bacterium]|jgi:hypothetical protein
MGCFVTRKWLWAAKNLHFTTIDGYIPGITVLQPAWREAEIGAFKRPGFFDLTNHRVSVIVRLEKEMTWL